MIRLIPSRIGVVLLAAACVVGGGPEARAEGSLRLRENITVEAAVISLGDVFHGLPEDKARQETMRAPAPGRSRRLSSALLNRMAETNGLDWRTKETGVLATVHRTSQTVPHHAVIDAIRRALAQRGIDDDRKVLLRNPNIELTLPTTVSATVRLEDFSYRRRTGRFSARAYAPEHGKPHARATVTGRAVSMLKVPVLSRRIDRGDTIQEDDVKWVERPGDDVRGNHITDAADLVGNHARRPLSPGELLRTSAVEEPVLVEDGSLVTIRLQTGRINLTAKGRALEDGTASDTIRVENISSEKTVSGVVTAPGEITVEPTSVPTN